MALKTQLRPGQITGSMGDFEGGIVDNRTQSGAGQLNQVTLNSGSLVGVLSEMASSIKRLHGHATFAGNATGTFATDLQVSGVTPTVTIGDNGAEDAKLVFNSAGTDFQIGVDNDESGILRISTSDFDGSAEVAELSAALNAFVGDVSTAGTFLPATT